MSYVKATALGLAAFASVLVWLPVLLPALTLAFGFEAMGDKGKADRFFYVALWPMEKLCGEA